MKHYYLHCWLRTWLPFTVGLLRFSASADSELPQAKNSVVLKSAISVVLLIRKHEWFTANKRRILHIFLHGRRLSRSKIVANALLKISSNTHLPCLLLVFCCTPCGSSKHCRTCFFIAFTYFLYFFSQKFSKLYVYIYVVLQGNWRATEIGCWYYRHSIVAL